MVSVFTQPDVNTETILHFLIDNEPTVCHQQAAPPLPPH